MQASQLNRKHIDSLTGARFVAVMIVVFSHFEFLSKYGKFGEIFWNYYHNNAPLSVDFYFILSGFGMMLSSIRQDPYGVLPIGGILGLIDYGRRHVRKIYPVYVAFLIVGIPFFLYTSYFEYGQPLWELIVQCVAYFFLDLTLLQSSTGYYILSHSLNGVCWFLSTLFCIYLVSPIIMKVIKQRIKTIKQNLMCMVFCMFFSFLLSILFTWMGDHTPFTDLSFCSPYRRVFYVIPGMLIAQIYNDYCNDKTIFFPKCITTGIFEYVIFGLSLLWFLLRFPLGNALDHFVYVIDMIVVSGDVFALAISRGKVSQILSNKRFVFLGEISMYIFLSHYNIRNYINLIFRLLRIESIAAAIIKVVTIFTLTMIVSIAIHHFRTNSNRELKA